MKQIYGIIFGITILISTSFAQHNHNADGEVTMTSQIAETNAGNINYIFQLKGNGKPIGDSDLVETHTKKLHLIVYDAALKEFSHVHPEYTAGNWATKIELPVSGEYFVWAQGSVKGGIAFSSYQKLKIKGGSQAWKPESLGDHRKASYLGSVVELSDQKITAGKMVLVKYTVTRENGTAPSITPYLGAQAHVIAVSPDGKQLIHVHPMDSGEPNSGAIHATFPTAGDYRIWVQFIDGEVLKTVPLSVTVIGKPKRR
ncbi:MAG: hypothetical protein V4736_11885 [Bdellovibrionota bacterium]